MHAETVPRQVRIAHVDDDVVDHLLVARCVKRHPELAVLHASSLDELSRLVATEAIDVILLDLHVGHYREFEALHAALALNLVLPIVVLTGLHEQRIGPDAVAIGAEDFLSKDDLDPTRLWSTIMKAQRRWRQRYGKAPRRVALDVAPSCRADLVPGSSVGPYEILHELGTGGMATVHLVRHRRLLSLHAMKAVRSDVPFDETRLLQEGRVQASIRHVHIVSATDLVTFTDGSFGLVMEYVRGPSLEAWLHDHRDLSGATWFELFRGIVRGVHHAHQHDVVHRDLKPSNVLLSGSYERWIPKVTDFGIAKVLDRTRCPQGLATQRGTAMGTPGYMAPEQIYDAATVDERADLFALGGLLYTMIAGQAALPGGHQAAQLQALITDRVVPITQRVPGLCPRVAAIVHQLLQVNADDRFPSAAHLLTALDPIDPATLCDRIPSPPPSDATFLEDLAVVSA